MDQFVPAVALASLVWMFVDFLRAVTNRDVKSVITHIVAWASGVGAVVLVAHTSFGDGVSVGRETLSSLDWWDLLVVGLLATSLVKPGLALTRALDGSDSNSQPPLVP